MQVCYAYSNFSFIMLNLICLEAIIIKWDTSSCFLPTCIALVNNLTTWMYLDDILENLFVTLTDIYLLERKRI